MAGLRALGRLMSSIPQERAALEQQQYDRSMQALEMALKGRELDIRQSGVDADAENQRLLRAIQLATSQRSAQQAADDDTFKWAAQAPAGTRVPDAMLPNVQRLLGSQVEERVPQLPSVSFGGVDPQVSLRKPAADPTGLTQAPQGNPAMPGGSYFTGTRQTESADANLMARNAALELSQQMQNLRLDLSRDRYDLSVNRPPMFILQTPEGFMRAPQHGGPASPIMTTGTPPQQTPSGETLPGTPPGIAQPRPPAALVGEAMKITPLYELLKEYKELSPGVNTSEGMERFWTGVQNVGGATTQNNQSATRMQALQNRYLAMLSRLSGEVGVLTQQDVDRAKAWTPNLWDSRSHAQWKITQFEQFLENKRGMLERLRIPMNRQTPTAEPRVNRFGLQLPEQP